MPGPLGPVVYRLVRSFRVSGLSVADVTMGGRVREVAPDGLVRFLVFFLSPSRQDRQVVESDLKENQRTRPPVYIRLVRPWL